MRHRSSLARVRDWLIGASLRLITRIGRRIPLSSMRAIGGRVGRFAGYTLTRMRRKARASITIAFPEYSPAERDGLMLAMFEHLGVSLFEVGWMMENLTAESLEETTEFEGMQNMRDAVAVGRGVMLVTGHCGNWEWLAGAVGLSGFRMSALARELDASGINSFIVESRQRRGIPSIGIGTASSAREILQTLRSGMILGVLLDQNIRAESVSVPFFGQPAPTPIGIAKIAIRSGALIVPGFIERRGTKQHIRFETPIRPGPGDDPIALTATLTERIEAQIRRMPDQWVWVHQRWKVRKIHTRHRGDQELAPTPLQS